MLKTETNTAKIERAILAAARVHSETETHGFFTAAFEHGQWWLTCGSCGAQWSVVDAEGGDSVDGFGFEEVTHGDEDAEHEEA